MKVSGNSYQSVMKVSGNSYQSVMKVSGNSYQSVMKVSGISYQSVMKVLLSVDNDSEFCPKKNISKTDNSSSGNFQ